MKINKEKMQELGFNFENMEDIYFYIFHIMEWLESHNKNYTKEQYYKISIVNDILHCLEV